MCQKSSIIFYNYHLHFINRHQTHTHTETRTSITSRVDWDVSGWVQIKGKREWAAAAAGGRERLIDPGIARIGTRASPSTRNREENRWPNTHTHGPNRENNKKKNWSLKKFVWRWPFFKKILVGSGRRGRSCVIIFESIKCSALFTDSSEMYLSWIQIVREDKNKMK